MNQVYFAGNLTKSPQIRATNSGKAVAQFTVACNRKTGDKELTDYISVVAWEKLAEAVGNQLKKGTYVFVTGRYSTRSYEASDGTKRYVTEVVAFMIGKPLDTRTEKTSGGTSNGFSQFGNAQSDDSDPIPF